MAQQQNTRTTRNTAQGDAWKQVFGTLENVVSRQGRKGPFVTATVRGKGKGANNTFDIIAFGEKAELVLAAGTGADVWAKGPQEPVTRKNAAGREYQELGPIKVVYFKDNSAEAEDGEKADGEAEAPEAQDDAPQAPEADGEAEGQALATADHDDDIPF